MQSYKNEINYDNRNDYRLKGLTFCLVDYKKVKKKYKIQKL